MYGCESWTIKKAEWWRIDALKLALKTLESLLDCKEIKPVNPRGNQSWIFTGRTDAAAQALILCHLLQRADSLEKTLMLGKIGGRRRRGWQRTRWLDGITDSMEMSWVNSRSWWWTGRPGVLQFMGSQRAGHDWATELNWECALYIWPSWLSGKESPCNAGDLQEIWVQSLGQEDPLEKGMTTHSNILAWEIPRTEKPVRL